MKLKFNAGEGVEPKWQRNKGTESFSIDKVAGSKEAA